MSEMNLVATMAERFHLEPEQFKRVIKATCGLDKARDEEFLAFLMIAHQHGFNPLTREIYAFVKPGGGIQPIVGVDGWYKKMNEHPAFNGIEFEDVVQGGQLIAVTAKIYRKDRQHPTEVTEYMNECRRNTDPWRQWPARMLRHKAAIQAIRIAFSLAGIMEPDEAERYEEMLHNQPPIIDDLPGTKTAGRVNPTSGAAVESRTETEPSLQAASPPHNESRKHRTVAPPLPPKPPEPAKAAEPADELIDVDEQDKLVQQGDAAGLSMSKLLRYVKETYQVADLSELRQSQARDLTQELRKRAT
jgi:phage recombination protein Bet